MYKVHVLLQLKLQLNYTKALFMLHINTCNMIRTNDFSYVNRMTYNKLQLINYNDNFSNLLYPFCQDYCHFSVLT
jgi:hypothetical protein